MPRLKTSFPSYRRHKQSGQAIVTLTGRDHLLGPHGSEASKSRYNRLIAEWLANDRQPQAIDGLDISELVARYWRFVESYYVKSGRPTGEQDCIRAAMRPLLKLYENEPASEFGPVALRTVRDEMLTRDWARSTVNKNVDRIRRMFRWATSEQLLPVECYQRLATLPGLRKGRTEAREAEPVKPVDDITVEATLSFMPAVVAAMVRVQRLTGMRPAEVCIMRACDIDRGGDVWRYIPASHKTEHHDQSRTVFIGPQAQAILLPYLLRDPQTHCFRPIDSEANRRAAQHEARVTPLNAGNRPGSNRRRKPKREAGECYTAGTYRRAVERACELRSMIEATGELRRLGGESFRHWQLRIGKQTLAERCREFHWTPGRLRHTAATEIRAKFGLEHAQVSLGHSAANTTEIYAERDASKGIEVARMIG